MPHSVSLNKDTALPTLIAETKRYAETDMLCYRAPEEPLASKQRALWDPIVTWAEGHYSIQIHLTEGLFPIDQPEATLNALEHAVDEACPMGCEEIVRQFAALTKLLGSVILALAVIHRATSIEDAITAAFLEETTQAEKWGEDEEAAAKRTAKMAECRAVAESLL